jgi:hemerythrin
MQGAFMDEDIVVWGDAYSVGLPNIDEQHKKLVVMINDLFQACKEEGASKTAAFARAFSKAADYTQTHFREEEEFLENAGYPDLPAHKVEHKAFVDEIWAQFGKFKEGNTTPLGLPRFLKSWLLNHIAIKDKKYAAFILGQR